MAQNQKELKLCMGFCLKASATCNVCITWSFQSMLKLSTYFQNTFIDRRRKRTMVFHHLEINLFLVNQWESLKTFYCFTISAQKTWRRCNFILNFQSKNWINNARKAKRYADNIFCSIHVCYVAQNKVAKCILQRKSFVQHTYVFA